MTLRIGARESAHIDRVLEAAYPEEGCGVLMGRDRDGGRAIEGVVGFENRRAEERERRYLIGPEQFLEADRRARAEGLDVLGFFHSHPDHPARPSAFDLEHAWPYYSYLIVSVVRGTAADRSAWRLRDDRSRFEPEILEVVDGPAAGPPDIEPPEGRR